MISKSMREQLRREHGPCEACVTPEPGAQEPAPMNIQRAEQQPQNPFAPVIYREDQGSNVQESTSNEPL